MQLRVFECAHGKNLHFEVEKQRKIFLKKHSDHVSEKNHILNKTSFNLCIRILNESFKQVTVSEEQQMAEYHILRILVRERTLSFLQC